MAGKKSVHFGSGNIGRGFVAQFLHQAGYEVVFIDVLDNVINDLQASTAYKVVEVDAAGTKTTEISNYRALNSKYDEPKVVEEIATADTVTCAVGPNILKFIAPVIAKGIEARKESTPMAVIACENAIMATNTLKGFILDKLSDETKGKLDSLARFANSAVDRIVPHQDPNSGLDVKIESFYEWCVEIKPFAGVGEPKVPEIHYVDDLAPYIERKLFTVNTGHATTAYYAYQKGKGWIHEAMQDEEIVQTVRNVLSETANLIVSKHGIPAAEQQEYVDKIVGRFSNPELKDKVERVGRAPLRKLSRNERLIGPAAQLAEKGESYKHLLGAVEVALKFQNVEGDDESAELAKILKENSAEDATTKLTGLEAGHPLYAEVVVIVKKVQG